MRVRIHYFNTDYDVDLAEGTSCEPEFPDSIPLSSTDNPPSSMDNFRNSMDSDSGSDLDVFQPYVGGGRRQRLGGRRQRLGGRQRGRKGNEAC